jgi:hypothetical protein
MAVACYGVLAAMAERIACMRVNRRPMVMISVVVADVRMHVDQRGNG